MNRCHALHDLDILHEDVLRFDSNGLLQCQSLMLHQAIHDVDDSKVVFDESYTHSAGAINV